MIMANSLRLSLLSLRNQPLTTMMIMAKVATVATKRFRQTEGMADDHGHAERRAELAEREPGDGNKQHAGS